MAGWVATLKTPTFTYGQTESIARNILGLTYDQKNELFASGALRLYGKTNEDGNLVAGPQTVAYARLGVEHISAFQKKYAKQLKAKKV